MIMFKPSNQELTNREYKKPSAFPLFSEVDIKRFKKVDDTPKKEVFNPQIGGKDLTDDKYINERDRFCGLAPMNFKSSIEAKTNIIQLESKETDNLSEKQEEPTTEENDTQLESKETDSPSEK